MKLDIEQIRSIATGVSSIKETDKGIIFSRFNDKELELYRLSSIERNDFFYDKCRATAGVKLSFGTDSKTLKIAGSILRCTSRVFYSFDVFVNGKMYDTFENFTGIDYPRDCTQFKFPIGSFEKCFTLPEGKKDVVLYFPWSVEPHISEISIDDGAYVVPVKRGKTLLCYGDSITQGYDAMYTSGSYIAELSRKLGADEHNKGIGGEIYFPPLAKMKDNVSPDYISVAYGTNDFSRSTLEDFNKNCKEFLSALAENYPNAKIFALTPIWRKDYKGERIFGDFENAELGIRCAAEDIPNVSVISGFDLVPKDEQFFSDLRLHPNDKGFAHYGENLYAKIKELI